MKVIRLWEVALTMIGGGVSVAMSAPTGLRLPGFVGRETADRLAIGIMVVIFHTILLFRNR